MDNDGELVKTSKTLVGFDQSTIIIPPSSSVVEKESCSLDLTSSTVMGARNIKSQENGSGVLGVENGHDDGGVGGGGGGGFVGDGVDLSVAKDIRVDEIVGEESVADDSEIEKESKEIKFEEKGNGVLIERVCGRKGFGVKFQDGITSSGKKPFADISSSIAQRTRNRIIPEEIQDVDVVDENGDEVDEEEDNIFCAGDFVWGKVKSHPWWPGRIYDPSNASEFSLRYKHEGRLLVAYFGDRTFAWCDPSQLKSFEENFEEMSKQSSLKTFVHAVMEAENEFGRLVKLQMNCSCVRENQNSMPFVVNAGVKEGVRVSENGVVKFSAARFDSLTMLSDIRCWAVFDSVASNTLELTVLKSQLSAFNHAKFGYSLPVYCEPVGIEDPMSEQGLSREGSCRRGPDDGDWFIGPGDQTPGQNGLLTPQKRRKSKSITELLGTDTGDELEGNTVDRLEGETQLGKSVVESRKKRGKSSMHELNGDESFPEEDEQSGKQVRVSGRKKRKTVVENKSPATGNLAITRSSTRKKKEEELSMSTTSDEKASRDSENRDQVKKHRKMGMVPRKLSINGGSTIEEGYERISPRERKLSKYLSPPYTNLLQRQRSSLSKVSSEEGGLVFSDVANVGERMAKTAGKIVGSPPLVKCMKKVKKSQKNDDPDYNTTSKQDLSSEANNGAEKSIGFLNCVLREIRSAALDPLYRRRDQTFDSVKGFLSSYRSSNYKNGSNYKLHKKELAGIRRRKRNSSGTMHGSNSDQKVGSNSDQKVPNLVDQQTPKLKRYKKSATKEEQKSESKPENKVLTEADQHTPKLKSSKKSVTEKEQKSDSKLKRPKKSAAKKEQNLESKTEHEVSCGPSSSSAEENVQNKKTTKSSETTGAPSESPQPESEPLAVIFIKQKLEAMTSMLGQSDGKMSEEIKSNLENDVKELLKKVKKMTATSTSTSPSSS